MPADIVRLDEKRLRKTGPARLARHIMGLPAKRRLEMILERPDAQAVVAGLDANDFYHTLQEIGPDDALPLLALASIEQVNHLFDIEWWRRDALEPAKALGWIDRLTRAGGTVLFQWLSNADFELLVSLFKQCISVDTIPEDIDLLEAVESLPPRTLDNHYFWESRYPQYDDMIVQLLSVIFEISYGFFQELLNSVLYAPSPEVEELAYDFHRARLQDHGIPDYYDALEIYKAIGASQFARKAASLQTAEERSAPGFALALLPPGDLFAKTVAGLEDPDLIETLQWETAALANKVIVADRLSPGDSQALRRAVDKTLAYVNLGLELRCGARAQRAEQILRDNFLEHLFRLAQAEIARVRGRLRATVQGGWLAHWPGGIKRLDGEWFDAAEELLTSTPEISRNSQGEASRLYDFFRTPSDLARADHFVDVIIGAGELYLRLSGREQEVEPLTGREEVTLGMFVMTVAANLLVCGELSPRPLRQSSWPEIFPLVQPRAISGAVRELIELHTGATGAKEPAREYFEPILRDYEEEMRPFSWQNPPDSNLVRFFVFS